MRLESLKKEIPQTPEFIHRMIESEVEKQLQNTKVVSMPQKRAKKWTGAKAAAAAVACLLTVSTAAYAGVNMYHMYLEKQGTYGVAVGIKPDENTGTLKLPEKIHDIDITAGYIPEGMEWMDERHLEYPGHDRTGGFSFDWALLDENGLDKAMQDNSVVDCEEKTFGHYEGVYLRYHDLADGASFNQRIYLLCPDVYRVVTIYIGNDVNKEDAFKVAENLVITENDTMIETADMDTWREEASSEKIEGDLTSVPEHQLPVYQIGDALKLSVSGEDGGGQYIMEDQISACVDSVQVADDLKLLGENPLPEAWADAIGADGKLVNHTLSYIKSGDGTDSLDEVVKTESVKQKLVYATVTYTNDSDREINHMLYLGTLVLMNQKDGEYEIYDPWKQSGDGYDRIIWDGVARTAEMTYSSVSEDYGNGRNYISSLKPAESIQVNMAWIVNENDLDHLYLNLNGESGVGVFSDSMLQTGLVDIRRQ